MENLIMNSEWAPGPMGGPLYFPGMGPITYDNLSINGYRTCSVTIMPPMMAQDFYSVPIDVKNRSGIAWGFTIRAVDASSISLVTEFFDGNMVFVRSLETPIENEVTYEFKLVTAQFTVPSRAEYVRLSIKFAGRVTACTFFAPVAFYS